jgi:hypothetical protein
VFGGISFLLTFPFPLDAGFRRASLTILNGAMGTNGGVGSDVSFRRFEENVSSNGNAASKRNPADRKDSDGTGNVGILGRGKLGTGLVGVPLSFGTSDGAE